jgi:transposase
MKAYSEDRLAITLKDRCRFLEDMVGVSVSESTLSRLLRQMGYSPKDRMWVCGCERKGRVPEGGLARCGLREARWEALCGLKRLV